MAKSMNDPSILPFLGLDLQNKIMASDSHLKGMCSNCGQKHGLLAFECPCKGLRFCQQSCMTEAMRPRSWLSKDSWPKLECEIQVAELEKEEKTQEKDNTTSHQYDLYRNISNRYAEMASVYRSPWAFRLAGKYELKRVKWLGTGSVPNYRVFFALMAMGQVNQAISCLVNCNKYMKYRCRGEHDGTWFSFHDLDDTKGLWVSFDNLDLILLAFAKYRVLQQLHWQRSQCPGQWQAFLSGTDLVLGAESPVLALRGDYWAIMKKIRSHIEVTSEDLSKVSQQVIDLLRQAESHYMGSKVAAVKNALDEVALNGGDAECLTNTPLKQVVQGVRMSPGFVTCLRSFLCKGRLTFSFQSNPIGPSSGDQEYKLTPEDLKQIKKELCS